MDREDSHITGQHKAPVTREQRPPGPVPLHHRLRLGEAKDGESNPFGDGSPSKVSTIANGGRKGW